MAVTDTHLAFSIRKAVVYDVNPETVTVVDDLGNTHALPFKDNRGFLVGETVRMKYVNGIWSLIQR